MSAWNFAGALAGAALTGAGFLREDVVATVLGVALIVVTLLLQDCASVRNSRIANDIKERLDANQAATENLKQELESVRRQVAGETLTRSANQWRDSISSR